ncbi:MAG: hypothetical protein LCH53_01740 [Bacteroidetes bacterium]|nr:hypothetical protein [Bacteroidota bacterium]
MTDDLAERLALYPDLGPQDRAALDAQIAADYPGGLPEHDEAQRFAALFDRARSAQPNPRTEALFGDGEPGSDDDRAALEAVFPADPLAHFRALDAKVQDVYPPPRFAAVEEQRRAERAAIRAADRASVPRATMRRPTWSRPYAWAAVLLLLAGSAAVWRGLQTPLGDFTAQELALEGYGTVRGDEASPLTTPEQRYAAALQELDDARTTTLGLFPRYDRERLLAARGLLDGVVRDSSSGDFLRLEALYVLGKTDLLLGNRDAATDALQQVVLGEGAKAPEANALLNAIHDGTPG